MTMTAEEARKAMENQYDIDRNQDRMIMALGKLQEAKGLIDEADAHNSLDELLGTLPVLGEDIDQRIVELKQVLGVELTHYQKEIRSISPKPEAVSNTAQAKTPEKVWNGEDYLDFHKVVDRLYQAIESDNLELVEAHLKYISDLSRSYGDPRSEAHDHLDLFSETQALYKAINELDRDKIANVIDEIETKAAKGVVEVKNEREFNRKWNEEHK